MTSVLDDTNWKLGELTIEGSVWVLNDARRRLIAQFANAWKNVEEASCLGPATGSRFHYNFQALEKSPSTQVPQAIF